MFQFRKRSAVDVRTAMAFNVSMTELASHDATKEEELCNGATVLYCTG